MSSKTFYNPDTNHIKRVKAWSNPDIYKGGYVNLGEKKIAEAFTSVSIEERKILWENLKGGVIDFTNLKSKLKHKLQKLGLYDMSDNYWVKNFRKTKGELLLERIINKV